VKKKVSVFSEEKFEDNTLYMGAPSLHRMQAINELTENTQATSTGNWENMKKSLLGP
jgi:hypothetical protein